EAVVAALLVGAGILLGGGAVAGPPPAEAARLVRAKIDWSFDPECPATLRDRATADPNGRDRSPYHFCRDAAISRQSNPNQADRLEPTDQAPADQHSARGRALAAQPGALEPEPSADHADRAAAQRLGGQQPPADSDSAGLRPRPVAPFL